MRMHINKSIVMLFSTATLGTAALAVGAYPNHVGAWKNGAIEGLATLWGATNGSGFIQNSKNAGTVSGLSKLVIDDADFAFLWSSAAMRTLGTLPVVTFSRADAANNTARPTGPATSVGAGQITAALAGNASMRYLPGTAGSTYGSSYPSLLNTGTISDPTNPAYQSGLPVSSGNNNQPTGGNSGAPAQTPTPLPAAFQLFVSGLACLGVLRIRTRKYSADPR